MITKYTAYQHIENANLETVKIKIDEYQGNEPPPVFFSRLSEMKKSGYQVTAEKTVTSVVQIATI